MNDIDILLISPAAPFVAFCIAGVCIAAMGLIGLERRRQIIAGFQLMPARLSMGGRLLAGHAAGLPLAGLLILTVFAAGIDGLPRTLMIGAALALYLYLGIVLPRKPIVAQQREARILRRLTPSFVSYVRVSLQGYDSPRTVLERYIELPDTRKACMQAVVREAIVLQDERRLTPFGALKSVTRERGCIELCDVTEQLAQSERDGTDPIAALAAFERTIQVMLRDEFIQMLKRRTMYLMVMIAFSLVIGILGNILFVMTAGGQIFTGR